MTRIETPHRSVISVDSSHSRHVTGQRERYIDSTCRVRRLVADMAYDFTRSNLSELLVYTTRVNDFIEASVCV